eukprot:scaffold37353_cov65-Phaeocystis_antarctica.AAC.9
MPNLPSALRDICRGVGSYTLDQPRHQSLFMRWGRRYTVCLARCARLQPRGVSAGRDDSGVMRAGLVAALAARRRRWAAAERGPLDIYMPLDAAQSMLLSRPTWLGGRRASSARPGGSGARGERVAGAGGLLVVVVMLGAEDGRLPAASLAAASLAPAHGRAWGMRTARVVRNGGKGGEEVQGGAKGVRGKGVRAAHRLGARRAGHSLGCARRSLLVELAAAAAATAAATATTATGRSGDRAAVTMRGARRRRRRAKRRRELRPRDPELDLRDCAGGGAGQRRREPRGREAGRAEEPPRPGALRPALRPALRLQRGGGEHRGEVPRGEVRWIPPLQHGEAGCARYGLRVLELD